MIIYATQKHNTGYCVENGFYRGKLGASKSSQVTVKVIHMKEETRDELLRRDIEVVQIQEIFKSLNQQEKSLSVEHGEKTRFLE